MVTNVKTIPVTATVIRKTIDTQDLKQLALSTDTIDDVLSDSENREFLVSTFLIKNFIKRILWNMRFTWTVS